MSRSRSLLIVSITLILLAVGSVSFLYFKIEQAKAFIVTAYAQIREARMMEDNVQSLRRSLRVTEEAQGRLDAYFIEQSETISFIEAIEAIGVQANTEIEIENVLEEGEESVHTLVLSIKAQGTFSQIEEMITALEHMPYEVRLEELFVNANIDPVSGAQSSIFEAQLKLRLISYTT